MQIIHKKFDTSTFLCDSDNMTEEQAQREIRLEKAEMIMWKDRMTQTEIEWKNARIAQLKEMLPRLRYDDKVLAYGWRSVERNV